MADKTMRVTLQFGAETSQAEAALSRLSTQLKNISNINMNASNTNGLRKEFETASQAAIKLRTNLQAAVDVNTGKLDLSKFNASMKKSGMSLETYRKQLSAIGPQGKEAFLNLSQAILSSQSALRQTNHLVDKLWDSLKKTVGWQISSSAIHSFIGGIQTAYGYAQDLNESLNNIRIVTGQNIDQMAKFADKANKAAKTLSTTTTAYTDAALIFYQQGLKGTEVTDRTDVVVKMANVTGDAAAQVSDDMTAIWNNFYDGSKSLEYYADAITALGAATASSTSEISQGLEKFASVAGTVGLSYEYATSALATVVAETRASADTVGTAFKTIFARLQGLELGETQDDGTDLNKYSQALANVGINIMDTNGQLKDMDVILDEMGDKWTKLSKAQQVALAETVAGTRQYTQLVSLMDNWDTFEQNVGVASGSEGTLQKQADIYAESWEAAQKRVKASAQALYSDLVDDKFFIWIANQFAGLLDGLDSIIDAMGGLKTLLPTLIVLVNKLFGNKIQTAIKTTAQNLYYATNAGQRAKQQQDEAIKSETLRQINNMSGSEVRGSEVGTMKTVYQEIVALQELLVKNADILTEENKEYLQILIEQKQAMGDELIAQGRNIDQQRQQSHKMQASLHDQAEFVPTEDEFYNYAALEREDAVFSGTRQDSKGNNRQQQFQYSQTYTDALMSNGVQENNELGAQLLSRDLKLSEQGKTQGNIKFDYSYSENEDDAFRMAQSNRSKQGRIDAAKARKAAIEQILPNSTNGILDDNGTILEGQFANYEILLKKIRAQLSGFNADVVEATNTQENFNALLRGENGLINLARGAGEAEVKINSLRAAQEELEVVYRKLAEPVKGNPNNSEIYQRTNEIYTSLVEQGDITSNLQIDKKQLKQQHEEYKQQSETNPDNMSGSVLEKQNKLYESIISLEDVQEKLNRINQDSTSTEEERVNALKAEQDATLKLNDAKIELLNTQTQELQLDEKRTALNNARIQLQTARKELPANMDDDKEQDITARLTLERGKADDERDDSLITTLQNILRAYNAVNEAQATFNEAKDQQKAIDAERNLLAADSELIAARQALAAAENTQDSEDLASARERLAEAERGVAAAQAEVIRTTPGQINRQQIANQRALDEVIRQLAVDYGLSEEELQEYAKHERLVGLNAEEAKRKLKAFVDAGEDVTETFNNIGQLDKSVSKIGKAINGLSSAIGIFNSIQNMIDTLSDPDVSGWEKLGTVLMTLGTVIGFVSPLISTLNTKISANAAAIGSSIVTTSGLIAVEQADAAQKIINEGLTAGLTSAKIAEELATARCLVAKEGETVESLKAAAAQEIESAAKSKGLIPTIALIAADTGLATAEGLVAIASTTASFGVKLLQKAFQALQRSILPLLIISLAIAAAFLLIKGLASVISSLWTALTTSDADKAKEKVNSLTEAVQNATTAYENAKTAAEEFKTAVSEYNDAINNLQELKKGTIEYAEALEDANSKARELIEAYELYGDWQYNNGIIEIDPQALNEAMSGLQDTVNQSNLLLAADKIRLGEAKKELLISQNPELGYAISNVGDNDYNYADAYDVLSQLTKEQFLAISNLQVDDNNYASLGLDQIFGELGEFDDLNAANKIVGLTNVIRDLGDSAEDVFDQIQNTVQNQKYNISQEALVIAQSNNLFNGDTTAQTAYANLLSQDKDFINKVTDNVTEAEDMGRGKIRTKLNDKGEELGISFTDKELAQMYAKYVEGWTDKDIQGAVYNKGNDRGELTAGDKSIEYTDDYMQRELAAVLLAQEMADNQEQTDAQQSLIEGINQIKTNFSGEAQSAILNSISNVEAGGQAEIDWSLISPEQAEILQSQADELGKQLGINFSDTISAAFTAGEYDATAYFEHLETIQSAQIDAQISESGLDADEISITAEALQELNDNLADNENAAKQLAVNNAKMNEGISDLKDNWDDWGKVLKSADKTSTSYAKAIIGLRKNMINLVGITEEASDKLDSSFFSDPENIKLFEQAANGSSQAVEQLGLAAANAIYFSDDAFDQWTNTVESVCDDETISDSIKNQISTQMQSAQQAVRSGMDELTAAITSGAYEAGTALSEIMGDEEGVANFVDGLNTMAEQTNMSVADMQSMLNSLGVEATVTETTTDEPIKVPKYVTHKEPIEGYVDKNGNPTAWEEWSVQTGTTTFAGTRTVASISYDEKDPSANIRYIGHGSANPTSANTTSGGGSNKAKRKSTDYRYHTTTKKREALDAKQTKQEQKTERAYGDAKIKSLEKELSIRKQSRENTKQHLKEAKAALVEDKAALEQYRKAAGIDIAFKFDSDGVIANGTEILKEISDQMYEMEKAGTDTTDLSNLQEAMTAYEETLKLVSDLEQQTIDEFNEMLDKQLELVSTSVEMKVEVNDRQLSYLDYLLSKVQDDAYNAATAIKLMGEQLNLSTNSLNQYKKGITDSISTYLETYAEENNLSKAQTTALTNKIFKAIQEGNTDYLSSLTFKNGNPVFDSKMIEALQGCSDSLLEDLQTLQDKGKEAVETVANTFSSFAEDINEQLDKFDRFNDIFSTYQNLVDLYGTKNLKVSNDILKTMRAVNYENAKNQLDSAKIGLKTLKEQQDKAVEALEKAQRGGDAALINSAKEGVAAIQEEVEAAEDKVRELTESTAQMIADNLSAAIEEIIANAQEQAFEGFSSLNELSEAFERKQSIADVYLKDYEKVYELSKLTRDINQSINDTDNIAGKQKLKSLIAEINQLQASGVKISQYDVDILRSKLELEQAELALKDAQNATSSVKLTRDNNGNWNYVYTADEDNIAKAEQEYEDKLKAYRDVSEEYLASLQDQAQETSEKYAELVQDVMLNTTLTEEEKQQQIAELTSEFTTMMDSLQSEMEKVLDNSDIQFGDTLWATMIGASTPEEALSHFRSILSDDVLTQMWTEVSDANKKLADLNLGQTITEGIETTSKASADTAAEMSELATNISRAYDDALDAFGSFVEQYKKDIIPIIQQTEELVLAINNVCAGLNSLDQMGIDYNVTQRTSDGTTTTKKIVGYDTGGYTGSWGSDGKLAILHQKELVLNANDTDNLLNAINVVRSLELNMGSFKSALASISNALNIPDLSNVVEQAVSIVAEFPNVSNSNEIEEAFTNLVNEAAQYAYRRT